jgi:hypothetical protein
MSVPVPGNPECADRSTGVAAVGCPAGLLAGGTGLGSVSVSTGCALPAASAAKPQSSSARASGQRFSRACISTMRMVCPSRRAAPT